MTWRDRTQRASWRGTPFYYEEVSIEGGRRGDDHEFPDRDTGYGEDSGRALRRIQGAAWLASDDHDLDAAALIGEFERKGRGEFVHPTLGRMVGMLRRYRGRIARTEQGMTRFEFEFVESGEAEFPSSALVTRATVDVTGADVESAALAAFTELWAAVGETAFIVSQARAVLTGWAASVTNKSDFIARTVVSLATVPMDAHSTIVDTVETVIASFTTIAQLREFYGSTATAAHTAGSSAEEEQVRVNAEAFARVVERYALAAACRIAAETEFALYDDAVDLRDELAARLAAEAATDQDLTGPCCDLRAAIVADIDDRVTSLARVRTVDLSAPTSSILLAWQLYGDPTRCDEIAQRNDPPRPAFLTGAVNVLSE